MYAPPVPVPADQFFRGQSERHHRELQIEPVRLEPEEQIDAEDDGKRCEAESVGVAARPAEQHVERIREEQLREDEGREGIDRRPIPAPVQQHRSLRAGLQIVLFPQHDFERERSSGENEQHRVPDGKQSAAPRNAFCRTGAEEGKARESAG